MAWLVAAGATAALLASVVVPRLAGATPVTVLTGSMTPGLPPGSLVVVKPVHAGEIGTGDVITYQRRSGEATVGTHRVVSGAGEDDGRPRYRTQGDANPVPDKDWVRPVQVRGRLWDSVPYLCR